MAHTAGSMCWQNAISTRPSLEAAVQEVAEALADFPGPADLGLVFISSAFTSEFPRLLPLLHEALDVDVLVGCSGGGVIGMTPEISPEEVEEEPALSVSLAALPGVTVHSFHLSVEDLPDLDSPPSHWTDLIGVNPADQPQFILMADPFSAGINDLLQGLDFAYPDAVKVGGLASVDSYSRNSGLFSDRQLHHEGVVGVALSGAVVLDAIVAQGCRPIGHPYQVVAAERNIVLKLEDPDTGDIQPPLEFLQELFQTLSESDRQLAQHSLFIGIAQDSFKLDLESGDFLIRNLLGVDPKVGAIAVGDRLRPGQRVQFHLRDADTSAEDLETLLTRYHQQAEGFTHAPVGALMFACMGRGEGLYGKPNFDSQLLRRYVKGVPVSGFFCGGEIGPIGKTTFLHGYTSVFGICRQP